ncbi:glycosyl hydrolase 115 family protein [Promicromonospora sp. CA-289599]|uniref:glycosyl hydrolase 115 family protein n=1 Tax=Promicromonospora sp. CA-289599 TaxID=3240014 RepID=UPI003D944ED1
MSRGFVLDEHEDGLVLAGPGTTAHVAIAESEPAAVRRAVVHLVRDLGNVTGRPATTSHRSAGANIVVGTIGTSPLVDAAIADGSLDVSQLRTADGGLRWEGFVIAAVGATLYVAGADRRGTVFGVYDLCEEVGVSPWYWWGDVPVHRRERITVAAGTSVADWPGVAYRGIFLNDEEELEKWAMTHTGDDTIGPETYERVFELILRLKGNYIWPAMHVGAFNHDPANGALAQEMGVVVGTSHCDMLLRSNEKEFGPWAAAQDAPVDYDYSVPGRNRELLQEYWRGSVRQNGGYEVSWTVGMRGIHDYGFKTSVIDTDEHLSDAEKHRARVALLGQVIDDQRGILAEQLGERAPGALQVFIPYKEVLPLYDAGLPVPDDVTIVWANDNFGYVRRYPTEAELDRPGGHGLYYHSSYWSEPPRSYLATSSTPLALVRNELSKAWDHGIRRLWVDNVGGLKPLEIETEFFLRCGWEAGKETTTADVTGFVEQWADKTFSGGHGKQVALLYATYYQLNNQRKVEHLECGVFAQTGYGDEASRRLAELRRLYQETNEILRALPDDEQEAFFELVAVKVHLAYLVAGQFLHADRSALAHQQGKASAADHHLELSRTFDAHKRALLHYYDTVLAGGRWRHVFTPEAFPPPVMAMHPAARPALRIGPPGLGVVTYDGSADPDPGARPALTFWPHGVATKWIEVFTTGAPGVSFTIEADDWIEVSAASGTVDTEARLQVRIADVRARAGSSGTLTVTGDDGTAVAVEVRVASAPHLDAGFVGAVEADGHVTIDPAHPDSRQDGVTSSWRTVPVLGRYGNSLTEACRSGDAPDVPAADDAVLTFGVHLTTPGAHLLELHRLPTLDSTGRLRVGVSFDDAPPFVVESPTTDEFRGSWTTAVLDNVERLVARLPYLDAGPHVLRLHALDQHVALSKIVLYTADRKETNLGPSFSHHTGRPLRDTPDPVVDTFATELDDVAREIYRTDPREVPLPPVVYTGPSFWDTPTTFKPNVAVPQTALAEPRDWTGPDGRKDVVAALGSGVSVESGGVVALEAEHALAQTSSAWSTPGIGDPSVRWTHTQAETDGGSGLAMHVARRGLRWDDPTHAPGLHYALDITTAGTYHVWLLVKFSARDDDACVLALDNTIQPPEEQLAGGDLYAFGTQEIWFWTLLSDLPVPTGRHTLSVLARKSGLRVDRLYLTTGTELPPADAAWRPSHRASRPGNSAG